MDRGDRLGQQDLTERVARPARLVAIQQRQDAGDLRRPEVELVAAPVPERLAGNRRSHDLDREDARRLEVSRGGELVAAADLGVMDARPG